MTPSADSLRDFRDGDSTKGTPFGFVDVEVASGQVLCSSLPPFRKSIELVVNRCDGRFQVHARRMLCFDSSSLLFQNCGDDTFGLGCRFQEFESTIVEVAGLENEGLNLVLESLGFSRCNDRAQLCLQSLPVRLGRATLFFDAGKCGVLRLSFASKVVTTRTKCGKFSFAQDMCVSLCQVFESVSGLVDEDIDPLEVEHRLQVHLDPSCRDLTAMSVTLRRR